MPYAVCRKLCEGFTALAQRNCQAPVLPLSYKDYAKVAGYRPRFLPHTCALAATSRTEHTAHSARRFVTRLTPRSARFCRRPCLPSVGMGVFVLVRCMETNVIHSSYSRNVDHRSCLTAVCFASPRILADNANLTTLRKKPHA